LQGYTFPFDKKIGVKISEQNIDFDFLHLISILQQTSGQFSVPLAVSDQANT